MTFQEAKKIIEIIDNGSHEYILKCRYCHEGKPVSTDAPTELLITMAEIHQKCMGESQ